MVVVYPAYASQQNFYFDLIEGIKQQTPHLDTLDTLAFPLDDLASLQQALNKLHPDKIIVLGKATFESLQKIAPKQNIIVGLANFNPSEYAGIDLKINGQKLFTRLSKLAPSIKRVYWVTVPGHDSVTISTTQLPVSPSFKVIHETDLINAIRHVVKLIESASPGDAILVPPYLSNDIFYKISELAWDKKVVLLSTNFYHLENGALMVFYPDEFELGVQLGKLAITPLPGDFPLLSLKTALNQRVAQHLELDFASSLPLFTVKIK